MIIVYGVFISLQTNLSVIKVAWNFLICSQTRSLRDIIKFFLVFFFVAFISSLRKLQKIEVERKCQRFRRGLFLGIVQPLKE